MAEDRERAARIDAEYVQRVEALLERHGVDHWADSPEASRDMDDVLTWLRSEYSALHGRRAIDGELLPDEAARRRREQAEASKREVSDKQEGGDEMATATKGRSTRGRRKAASPASGTRLRGKDLVQRNREILKALKAGETEESVARRYRLRPKTVGYIRWRAGQATKAQRRRIPARA